MEIFCGFAEYLTKKDLKKIISQMADLSGYKSVIIDSIGLSEVGEQENRQTWADYQLFTAGMVFLFSHAYYRRFIPEVLQALTRKQRSNFYSYYCSFKCLAVRSGFLVEYDLIEKQIRPAWLRVFCLIGEVGPCIFIWFITKSWALAVVVCVALQIIESKLEKNVEIKMQNDFLIQNLNQKAIASEEEWAKEMLVQAGWLTGEGRINN